MSDKIQAIRGMKDILPNQSPTWLALEKTITQLVLGYGYAQIRTPLVEKTEVFHRAIGKATDIVEKEMYAWQDNNGDKISLRPEGTASTVRLMIEHNLVREGAQKVWYLGAMFRRERPQKGRLRQFHQFGLETFGFDQPKVDAELIEISHQLWQKLGITARLEINSLGSIKARKAYKVILVEYFSDHKDELDNDSLKRLTSNPLRILDSKNPDLTSLIQQAPKITEHLDEESAQHFAQLQTYLKIMDIDFVVNPNLVRGLDYYNRTVFEWVSEELGAQGTICAGGRYDGLFEQMGGKATPAAGFAIGIERLILLLDEKNTSPESSIYLITSGDKAEIKAIKLAHKIRTALPHLRVYNNLASGSLRSQFKKANKLNADFAIILAEDEVKSNTFGLKPLKTQDEQSKQTEHSLIEFLLCHYNKSK